MKKKCILSILLAVFLLLFSGTLYAQSHTIISEDEIVSFEDPDGVLLDAGDLKGSLILSWDQGVTGLGGGFCDLTVYTGLAGGGKYEISLVSVLSSNANMVKGFWGISKNGGVQTITTGTATNLNAGIGGEIIIKVDGFVIKITITFKFDGMFDPAEVTGQLFVDGFAFVGAKVKMKDDDLEVNETDMEGKYLFILSDFDEFKKVVLVFINYDPEIVVSGYVYVGGQPLVGASVTIQNQAGVLATTVTNAEGYYKSSPILGAVGAGNNKVKTIIKP